MKVKIEEIKNRDIRDDSKHYRMINEESSGYVEFSISNNEFLAYKWTCPGEGRKFLKELEKYADKKGLMLIVNNVINPKLEKILRDSDYEEYYMKIKEPDDIIQCWKRRK